MSHLVASPFGRPAFHFRLAHGRMVSGRVFDLGWLRGHVRGSGFSALVTLQPGMEELGDPLERRGGLGGGRAVLDLAWTLTHGGEGGGGKSGWWLEAVVASWLPPVLSRPEGARRYTEETIIAVTRRPYNHRCCASHSQASLDSVFRTSSLSIAMYSEYSAWSTTASPYWDSRRSRLAYQKQQWVRVRLWVYKECESGIFSSCALSLLPSPSPCPQRQRISREEESAIETERVTPALIDIGTSPLGPSSVVNRPPSVSLLPPYNPLLLFPSTLKALGVPLPLLSPPPFPRTPSVHFPLGAYTRLSASACDGDSQDTAQAFSFREYSSPLCPLDHASPTSFSAPNPCSIPLTFLPPQRSSPPSAPDLDLFRPKARQR
jgi:hypothetical protein